MSKPMEIEPGTRFGRLTVIEKVEDKICSNGKHKAQFKCKCDCGNETIVIGTDLKVGKTKSCGCLHKDACAAIGKANTTFGLSKTPEAQAYYNMRNRILNPNYEFYYNYGGRGITICDRWIDPEMGLKNFYDDMHPTYFPGGSLDRIDVNGNYCPENCRWVDRITQANNTNTNRLVTHDGDTFTATEWNRALGYSKDLVRDRLELGWTDDEAVIGKKDSKSPKVPCNLVYYLNEYGRPIPPEEYFKSHNE